MDKRILFVENHKIFARTVVEKFLTDYVLNRKFTIKQIDELVDRKRAGAEKMLLTEGDVNEHNVMLDRLESLLQDAYENSALPEEALSKAALDDFVVRIRLQSAR